MRIRESDQKYKDNTFGAPEHRREAPLTEQQQQARNERHVPVAEMDEAQLKEYREKRPLLSKMPKADRLKREAVSGTYYAQFPFAPKLVEDMNAQERDRYEFYKRNAPLNSGKLAIIKDAPLAVNLRRIADKYGIVMASVEINQRDKLSSSRRLDGVEVDTL